MVKPNDVLKLYRATLKAGSQMRDYNFRYFIKRRAIEDFREYQKGTDKNQVEQFYEEALRNLHVIKRQVIVQNMYYTAQTVMEDRPSAV